MSKQLKIIFLLGTFFFSHATLVLCQSAVNQTSTKALLDFIASDEFKGRDTGTPELDSVGRYLANEIAAAGWQPFGDDGTFFQNVPLAQSTPAEAASMTIGNQVFDFQDDFVAVRGDALPATSIELVFVGYGDQLTDYIDKDLKGKVAVALVGTEASKSTSNLLNSSSDKAQLATENGAIALIELWRDIQTPWQYVTYQFKRPNLFINDQKRDECVFEDTYVLVCDGEISNILQIENILKPIISEGKKLLIIAPCSTNVINTLAANVVKNGLKIYSTYYMTLGCRYFLLKTQHKRGFDFDIFCLQHCKSSSFKKEKK